MIAERMPMSVALSGGSKQAAEGLQHQRGLLVIGIFKLSKSVFFLLVGLGAVRLLHRDLGNEVLRAATALRFDPEGRVVSLLMERAGMLDTHKLKEIGFATFAYSGLALVEGIGLLLRKGWAEYLTLGLTIAFLPWEAYELSREVTAVRLALLGINLVVLAYLLWLLRAEKK